MVFRQSVTFINLKMMKIYNFETFGKEAQENPDNPSDSFFEFLIWDQSTNDSGNSVVRG